MILAFSGHTSFFIFSVIPGHERAQKYTLIQAKALAMSAIDVMMDPELLQNIKQTFEADISSNR